MKNLDLNAFGVKDASYSEMKEINGGDFGITLGIIGISLAVLATAAYVVDNWDRVEEGWADGAEAAANN